MKNTIATDIASSPDSNVVDKQARTQFTWWDQIPTDTTTGLPTLATKTQLGTRGLKAGIGQKPVGRISYYARRYEHSYNLYAVADAVPKRKLSEEAKAKAIANLEAIRLRARTCKTCGTVKDSPDCLQYGECWKCVEAEEAREHAEMLREDRDHFILWARNVLARPFLVLDSETTGLPDDETAGIVGLSIIDGQTGGILFDSLVKPRHGMGATHIHGITDEDVADAPDARGVWEKVEPILTTETKIYAYSSDFDESMVGRLTRAALWQQDQPFTRPPSVSGYFRTARYGDVIRGKDGQWLLLEDGLPTESEAAEHGLSCRTREEHLAMDAAYQAWQAEHRRVNTLADEIEKGMVWRDIMEPYSAFVGWWHSYYRSYTWQRLGGGHRALGDARAALSVIWRMATATHSMDGLAGDGI